MTPAIEGAVDLLRDQHLVWSADIECIRADIANLLLVSAALGGVAESVADVLARKIIADEPEGKAERYDLGLERRDA